jgi:hypothetical protein
MCVFVAAYDARIMPVCVGVGHEGGTPGSRAGKLKYTPPVNFLTKKSFNFRSNVLIVSVYTTVAYVLSFAQKRKKESAFAL